MSSFDLPCCCAVCVYCVSVALKTCLGLCFYRSVIQSPFPDLPPPCRSMFDVCDSVMLQGYVISSQNWHSNLSLSHTERQYKAHCTTIQWYSQQSNDDKAFPFTNKHLEINRPAKVISWEKYSIYYCIIFCLEIKWKIEWKEFQSRWTWQFYGI